MEGAVPPRTPPPLLLDSDEKYLSMVRAKGFSCSELLQRKPTTCEYRGNRLSDGAPVLLRRFDSRFMMQRSQHFIEALSGTGVAPRPIEKHFDEHLLVFEDHGGIYGDSLLQPGPYPDLQSNMEAFLKIAIALSNTLNVLHSKRIIHGSISLSNLFCAFDKAGEPVRVELHGFHGAIRFEELESSEVQAVWQQQPLAYISPEQTGQVAIRTDYRSDLYSLGVALYQLCTGSVPCCGGREGVVEEPVAGASIAKEGPSSWSNVVQTSEGEKDVVEQLHEVLFGVPRLAHDVNPRVPTMVSAVIARLLAKQPEMRYQSAYGLAIDLRRCLEDLRRDASSVNRNEWTLGEIDPPMMFRVPHAMLVGRSAELKQLQEQFVRARSATKPLCVLLEGPGGIGKSALIDAALNVRDGKLLCLRGKFEENKKEVPYSAFVQAFSQLVRKVLILPPDESAVLRHKLRRCVKSSSSLIVQTFPDMEKLLGGFKKPSSPTAENPMKVHDVIISLLQTIASPTQPLILVIDDMQWADLSSLKLWQAIMTAEISSLLIIGAYRGNSLAQTHLLVSSIEMLKESDSQLEEIHLQPLQISALAELLISCIPMEKALALRLAEIVLQKTLGNPFFVIHYLKHLYDTLILSFDPAAGAWTCNVDQVASMELADNAAQLMITQFKRIDPKTLRPLLQAACFGGEFSAVVLAAASNTPEGELNITLKQFVERSYIYQVFPGVYKFCHDQVHSAAYECLSVEEREAFHLQLARVMLNLYTPEELSKNLFDLVSHLSRASSKMAAAELRRVVELFKRAAEKAVKSAAYAAAANYATDGLRFLALLSPDYWKTDQELAFHLSHNLLISLNWIGENERAYKLYEELLGRAVLPSQKIDVCFVMVQALLATDIASQTAAAIGFHLCELVKLSLPVKYDTEDDVKPIIQAALTELDRVGVDYLEKLPEDKEPLVQRVIACLIYPTYAKSIHLCTAMCAMALSRALQHGPTDAAMVSVCHFVWMCGLRGYMPPVKAAELSAAAIRIIDRYPRSPHRGTAYTTHAMGGHNFVGHIFDSTQYFNAAIKHDLETFNRWNIVLTVIASSEAYAIGDQNLDDMIHEQRRFLALLSSLRAADWSIVVEGYLACFAQLQMGAAAFIGPGQFPNSPQWQELEAKARARRSLHPPLVISIWKSFTLFFLERYDQSFTASEANHQAALLMLRGQQVLQYIHFPTYIFSMLAVTRRPVASETATKIRSVIAEYEAASIPFLHNLSGVLKLIQARATEVLNNDPVKAAAAYEEAITLLHQQRLPLYHGLALTLAGNNAGALGMRTAAKHFYTEACRVYATYRAPTLVAALVRQHGGGTADLPPATSSSSSISSRGVSGSSSSGGIPLVPITAQLDAHTVLQLTRAISQEIVLEKLLDEVTRVLVENTGADLACLISADKLPDIEVRVQRQASDSNRPPITHDTIDANTAEIIRYVGTFNEAVLLDNAFADARFTPPSPGDDVTGIKSVLCLPMKCSGYNGVVYLENRHIAGAFTTARKALVEAILPQISIGIEKARLVQALTQASEELARKNETLQRADMHKDQFLAVTTHELRTPLHGIISATSLLFESSPLTDEQREYASVVLSASKSLLNLVEDILDLTRIRASKLRIEFRSFLLFPLIETTLEVLSSTAGDKGIDLQYEFEEAKATYAELQTRQLVSDPFRIQQVLTNLVSNAIKFTQRGSVLVTVSCPEWNEKATLQIKVTDTGIGIAPDKLPRLFQMFSQLDTPDPSRYDGYGVGLFICHSVVHLLGGSISAESDGKNGSTFTVTVPVTIGNVDDAPPSSDEAIGVRCLVWTAYAHTKRILSSVLQRARAEVAICADAVELEQQLMAREGAVCIIVDLALLPTVRQVEERTMRKATGIVVAGSYVAWRQLESKERCTPLFSPFQYKKIVSAVCSACSGVIPRTLSNETKHANNGSSGAHATPSPPSPASSRLSILVVEDNVLNAKVLCKMLSPLYDVATAGNGAEAINAVKMHAPDLILMDIQMPVLDGVAATQEIRRLGFRMPIIAATASLSLSERELAQSAGMQDVIGKPFTKAAVLPIIRRHIFSAATSK